MKSIKVISRHNTLAEAVIAANIDLSYNPAEAQKSIKLSDAGYNRDRGVTEAFVCEDGKVRYVYQADIALLHKFTPFVSSLHDGPFQFWGFMQSTMELLEFVGRVPKCGAERKKIRELQKGNAESNIQIFVA
jgi:hypothetical protein